MSAAPRPDAAETTPLPVSPHLGPGESSRLCGPASLRPPSDGGTTQKALTSESAAIAAKADVGASSFCGGEQGLCPVNAAPAWIAEVGCFSGAPAVVGVGVDGRTLSEGVPQTAFASAASAVMADVGASPPHDSGGSPRSAIATPSGIAHAGCFAAAGVGVGGVGVDRRISSEGATRIDHGGGSGRPDRSAGPDQRATDRAPNSRGGGAEWRTEGGRFDGLSFHTVRYLRWASRSPPLFSFEEEL
jgi:hypothetical protein